MSWPSGTVATIEAAGDAAALGTSLIASVAAGWLAAWLGGVEAAPLQAPKAMAAVTPNVASAARLGRCIEFLRN
ncbi:MAG TPA: hypothetical protein VFW20_03050 [Candidatus Limnocylindrales bacterium]|nr:hypothetical protein [Candidatus Limnocylindrales bacterium]